MNESPRFHQNDGHVGHGRCRQRSHRRPARAVAAGQGARVEVQGPGRHRAGEAKTAAAATPTSASRARTNTASTPAAGTASSTTSAASAAAVAAAAAVDAAAADVAAAGSAARRRRRHDGPRSRRGGFGVRVIHSGVWGFASSPIVTEDEIRRITQIATEVAKASAIAKKADVRLAPVPAYLENWVTPMKKDPATVPQTDKQALRPEDRRQGVKTKGVTASTSRCSTARVEVLRVERRLLHRAGVYTTTPTFTVTAEGRRDAHAQLPGVPMRRLGDRRATELLENAERIAAEAVEICTAKPLEWASRISILTPSHAMLTIHEIVAHATELDRIVGYEANYAGTSFVKLSRCRQAQVRLEALQHHRRRKIPGGLGTVGYDDDGVKTKKWPIVRDGILVGLQTNRETAHSSARKTAAAARPPTRGATIRSCGCRTCTSSRARPDRRRPSRSSPTRRTAC